MAAKGRKQPTDEVMKARALSRWEGEGGAPAGGRNPELQRASGPAKRKTDRETSLEAKRAKRDRQGPS